MKKLLWQVLCVVFTLTTLALQSTFLAQTKTPVKYKNVGYVFQRGTDISKLDVTKVTHINYSFGLIYNNEYLENNPATGKLFGTPPNPDVRTPEPVPEGKLHTIYLHDKVASDLARMGELRAKNSDLKILLSVGGFDARGFSDAAATEENRKIFANSCKEVIDLYNLDGIDLDWEFPVIAGWGSIKGRPEDRTNFTLMLREIRNTIGKEKLLTIAGSSNFEFTSHWTEFKEVIDLLDYINIMTYDFQYGTCYYGSALYSSKLFPTEVEGDDYNCDMAVRNYINNGCPPEKINMGLAFAAIIPGPVTGNPKIWEEVKKKLDAAGFRGFGGLKMVKDLLEDKNGFSKKWDPDAKNMYISTTLSNGKEQFVLGYIESRSLSEKIKYVKDMGLGGLMFWEFGSDYDNSLVRQIAAELK